MSKGSEVRKADHEIEPFLLVDAAAKIQHHNVTQP